jgi:alkanesulfonate monooxygenase SsuD/methylene tetrahydromethanopterin reductase-like flavin-dependent oxidoreductase (luciferase family)
MLLSTLILPAARWPEAQRAWRDADASGLHGAYTYDHLSWRAFRERDWFTMTPTLAAAASVTTRVRLGPLVTTPNFRHPLLLAKDLIALDDISNGRVIIGVGSGGTGYDATVLGESPLTAAQRHQRFEEFTRTLDTLLREPASTIDGDVYRVHDSRQIPGPVQTPRPPLYLSALGPKSLALTAQLADGWVSFGSPDPAVSTFDALRRQLELLDEQLAVHHRPPSSLHKVVLDFASAERPLVAYDAFVDWAGRCRELGIDEVVVHWPVPDSPFAVDPTVFERVLSSGVATLADWH